VSVRRVMKRLAFTPKRPLFRAWQQDPALVERRQKTEYLEVAAC